MPMPPLKGSANDGRAKARLLDDEEVEQLVALAEQEPDKDEDEDEEKNT